MRFPIDAHLPKSLVRLFRDAGYEAMHTSALPGGNLTGDGLINLTCFTEGRVLITKDLHQ
jgi:predicted nuclease of predicted toxin-antitoxin system